MRQLSFWAQKHPVQARWLIVVGRVITGTVAVWWGIGLGLAGYDFAETAFLISATSLLVAWVAYPFDLSSSTYAFRKACDTLLFASSLAFWLGWGNWHEARPAVPVTTTALPVKIALADTEHRAWATNTAHLRDWLGYESWRLKKVYRTGVKKLWGERKQWDHADWGVLGTVLAYTVMCLLLGVVVVMVSCSLACNGHEGWAILAGLLGLSLFFWLLFRSWRWAVVQWRRNKRNRKMPEGARSLE